MRKGNILPIALIAFAIVAFVFMVDYSISGGKWPWSTENTNTTKQTSTNTTANVNAVTNTITTTNANVSLNTNATTPEVLPAGVKRYTSTKLGVTFTYLIDQGGTILEVGDKVYIGGSAQDPTSGQWVEVMSKEAGDTITQAIQKKYLANVDPAKCYVEDAKITGLPTTVSTAIIGFPISQNEENPWWEGQKNCPVDYSKTNGVRYFWMDSAHPDKLLFFSIGQYGIQGLNDNYQTTWQQTLRITESDPTAGWKTYTNKAYNYSIKYPSTWSVSEALAPKTLQIVPPDSASKTSIEMGPVVFITAGVKEISDELSNRHTVTINGTEAIRTSGGAMYDEDITFFPQMSGYISVGWPTQFAKDYPEYEQILFTFTK